ncbi:MAG: phosphocholine cytidylyltransferase family protein [Candidatus Marinimicrobia bacterium]|jgi:choline kinase|nr:phosphocholine cytidylyltransferase family protein [Candidatus Neomarinimicrobiota bacterium]MBT3630647.1 phosphocholine cytidylyltransferase family protein [Candidatus Neomarinimicrobiota bacterium]MBT3823489.1 phosphocholine cytidylyltransferase family protein [Candidatus Neomarinimicrobiota bacterium]MBT4130940.1 phosphocholine cytidylyltransferase family protein [Candidatus Neomarinimicrobiota bacterium]MBT4295573.1 phosphocholine cytidylyltransferase family protein [Candidatus Neomarini
MVRAIILAAGIGSRLGNPRPKPLTKLSTGELIMGRQVESLQQVVSVDDILVVVGFKKDLIMEEFSELTYVFNNVYDRTNTSKSLLKAMRKVRSDDVIWLNGDVVFDPKVLARVVQAKTSCMAVNTASVAEEEVKYTVATDGSINQVSKIVMNALGESVGINKIVSSDIPLFIEMLERCEDDDYFERGIEFAIENGLKIYPVDVSDVLCIEVDFTEDLEKANQELGEA